MSTVFSYKKLVREIIFLRLAIYIFFKFSNLKDFLIFVKKLLCSSVDFVQDFTPAKRLKLFLMKEFNCLYTL